MKGSSDLVVMRLKVLELVDAARVPEITTRQWLYPAELSQKSELPELDIRSTGSSQFELKVGPSSEAANYSLISGLSESSVKFRARCYQDELVFLYTSLTQQEKLTLLPRNNHPQGNPANNQTAPVSLRAKKISLGQLNSGSYSASKGYLTKIPDGDPIFLKSALEGHEYYFLSQAKGILLQNTKTQSSQPGIWWSAARWTQESENTHYVWIILIVWILIILLVCCRMQRRISSPPERMRQSNQVELPNTDREERSFKDNHTPQAEDREYTETSDPEPEQEI